MKRLHLVFGLLLVMLLFPLPSHAGIRLKGNYSGTVIFDRWGGCILHCGSFVMYVSEKVKEELRPYDGKGVELNATEVSQPVNPGQARINKFEYVGPAQVGYDGVKMDGLKLKTIANFHKGRKPQITVEVLNESEKELMFYTAFLSPMLLTRNSCPPEILPFATSDGPSKAAYDGDSFWRHALMDMGGGPKLESGSPYKWNIPGEQALPNKFILLPKEKRQFNMTFTLPAEEYEFFVGYCTIPLSSECLSSNRTSFDVLKDGNVKRENVKATGH